MAKVPQPMREFKIVRCLTGEDEAVRALEVAAELTVLGEKGFEVLAVPTLPEGWVLLSRAVGIQWMYVDEPSPVEGARLAPQLVKP